MSSLLAGEQLLAPVPATVIASVTSWLEPASIRRRAVSDSPTPPAHDSMSAFMVCRTPRRSAARSARMAPAAHRHPRPAPALSGGKLVSRAAHGRDQAEAQLGAQAPHAHVDDV